jgi:hypothetical protein
MTEFDYDIKIKIPVELRLWDKDGKEVTQTMDLVLGSEVIEDDTLQMIFRDIDNYINTDIMRNR